MHALCLCVPVCLHVFMQACVFVCGHVCGSQGVSMGHLPQAVFTLFFEIRIHKLATLGGQHASEIFLLYFTSTVITMCHHTQIFSYGCPVLKPMLVCQAFY